MRYFLCGVIIFIGCTQSYGVGGGDEGQILKRGDVNDDGLVDVSDPIALNNYLFIGEFRPGCYDACDVNDDSLIDSSDVIFLLNYTFLGGEIPASPFPYCGLDLTPDSLTCNYSLSCPIE